MRRVSCSGQTKAWLWWTCLIAVLVTLGVTIVPAAETASTFALAVALGYAIGRLMTMLMREDSPCIRPADRLRIMLDSSRAWEKDAKAVRPFSFRLSLYA